MAIEIIGKVVGMGYLDPKITFAQIRAGGDIPTYIIIRPNGAKTTVKVRSQIGTDQYRNAGHAMASNQDFHYKGDLA